MIRQRFNEGWKVKKGTANMLESFTDQTGGFREVRLPHDAMIHEERTPDTKNGHQTGFYPGGFYTYVKELDVPEEWEGKKILLEFEGISNYPRVYVNGDYCGGCHNAYSAFYLSLEHFLKYGEKNEIRVEADNEEETSRWYCGGGIYRDVNLLTGGEVCFEPDRLRVTSENPDPCGTTVLIDTVLTNRGLKNRKVWIETKITDGEGRLKAEDRIPVTLFAQETVDSRQRICIPDPCLWDAEHPNLYHCSVRVVSVSGDGIYDEDRTSFGIRKLELSAETGLKVNGKEVKLRGACIHLDNGVLGMAALRDADERKIRLLKEAGFNCVRSSHQPMGKQMLEACDRLGMYVMDELADMWTRSKNKHDYSSVFQDSWEQDVVRMVEKDYNHPCVILYSTGNEIQEAGTAKGAQINRMIEHKIKELDPGRYTVSAVNGMLAGQERLGEILAQAMGISQEELISGMSEQMAQETESGQEGGADALNGMMAVMQGPLADAIAVSPILGEMIEEFVSVTDIAGYNYLTALHEAEKQRHPNRVVLGTETFPADIVRLWKIVKSNPHVIGDMTWTGYDYLGEAGCGIFHYDGAENFSAHWPDRTAYIGDLDLIGYRRPISYLRECVYGLRKDPYIAVLRMNRNGQKHSVTPWMWKDNIASWTWPGYEGRTASVDVYADADEVELILNGKSLGKKTVKDVYTATYEVPYEAGCLTAYAYTDGKKTGSFILETAEEDVELNVHADKQILRAGSDDLAFLTVNLRDKKGRDNLFRREKISVRVDGPGELAGYGSADPQAEGSYDDPVWETYDGYVMAVVRAGRKAGTVSAVFETESGLSETVEIEVR